MAAALDYASGEKMTRGNDEAGLHLTRKERDLLDFLRQHAGRCLSRDVLLKQVWGYRSGVKSRTLDVHVQRLRKKLGPEQGSHILTVFRSGYLWTGGDNDLGIGMAAYNGHDLNLGARAMEAGVR